MDKIFIGGEVKERIAPTAPKPIKITTSGFPSSGSRNQVPKSRSISKAPIIKPLASRKEDTIQTKSDIIDFEKQNIMKVESMSDQERQSAINDIKMLLSPKSIEYLLKQSKSAIATRPIEPKVAATHESTYQKDANPSELLSQSLAAPTDEIELNIALKTASKNVQDSIAWTQPTTQTNSLKPTVTESSSSFRMNKDRFNLQGVKVIAPDILLTQTLSFFQSIPLLTSTISSDTLHSFSKTCVDCMYTLHIVESPPAADSQPQHELHNHQFDQDAPGYTVTEIIEVFIYPYHQYMYEYLILIIVCLYVYVS